MAQRTHPNQSLYGRHGVKCQRTVVYAVKVREGQKARSLICCMVTSELFYMVREGTARAGVE